MGSQTDPKAKLRKFLLQEYQRELSAEHDRWNKIEEKANRVFSFTSSITAILVGLYALGETMARESMPLVSLIPFLWFYAGGIVLFALSATFSLCTQSVTAYIPSYLPHEQSAVLMYLDSNVSDIETAMIEKLVETLFSLGDVNSKKARALTLAQVFALIGVFAVVLSMFVAVGVLIGWIGSGG
ncbi:MAG: hypothetical protein ACFFE6_12585 [Candidatus Thorarchaeota archaeon]